MPFRPHRWLASLLAAGMMPLASFAGKAPPAWVGAFPHDPDKYIGIGRADKRSHPGDYREAAQAAALAQISREISVQVKAENTATQREDASGWEETYAQRVNTLSRNELTGYELAGVHETPEEFWALYTLEKEGFRRSLDEKETRFEEWLERESEALERELAGRRIQSAVDRYARIRKEYSDVYQANPLLSGRTSAIPARYGAVSWKMESISGNAKLVFKPAVWTYSLTQGRAHLVQIGLIVGTSKEKWTGPLGLTLENRAHADSGICRIETDPEGWLDLSLPFRECGLKPGTWRVGWAGAGKPEVHADIRAEWVPIELGLVILAEGVTVTREWKAQVENMVRGTTYPGFRVVPGNSAARSLQVRMREAALDSLEGMFFTSMRAEVSIPGISGPMEIRGKAGHADKARAESRAIRDFAEALRLIPLSRSSR
jgi:hypothetical protein